MEYVTPNGYRKTLENLIIRSAVHENENVTRQKHTCILFLKDQ